GKYTLSGLVMVTSRPPTSRISLRAAMRPRLASAAARRPSLRGSRHAGRVWNPSSQVRTRGMTDSEAGETMRWIRGVVVLGGTAAGVVAARRVLSSRTPVLPGLTRQPEWLVATVNRAPTDITHDGRLPEPLARLGDA